jgi:hypothetical protein
MVLPAQYSQGTPNWYDNPMFPSYEEDPLTYEQRLADFVASQNGAPAGVAPTIDPVTGWRTAGSQRMADMSQGEYDANYLNARANSAAAQVRAGNPDHPNATGFLAAMTSRNQVRPEQFGSAYNAASAGTGGPSPILLDSMLNLLESFGYAPPAAAPPTGPGTGPDDLGPRPPAGVLDPSQLPVGLPHRGGDGGLHATPGRDRQEPPNAPGRPRDPRLPTDPIGPGPSAPGSPSSGVLPGSLGDSPSTPWAGNDWLQAGGGGGSMFGGPAWQGPSAPPSIQPGMEDILAGYLNGGGGGSMFGGPAWQGPSMGGGMGGNPDTIARFMEFQKRQQMQMQPPIQPLNGGY